MFREVKFDQHHQSRLIEHRLTMLEKRLEDAHPRWSLEKNLILNEKEACIKEKVCSYQHVTTIDLFDQSHNKNPLFTRYAFASID